MYMAYFIVENSACTEVMHADSQLKPVVLHSAFWCFSCNKSTKYDKGLKWREQNYALANYGQEKKYKFVTAICHSLNFELREG